MDTKTAILSIVTGAFLPLLTGYLTSARWAEWIKFLVVISIAAIVGFAQVWLTNQLPSMTWENAISILGMTYVASAATFWLLVDRTGIKDWLAKHGVGPVVG